LGWAVVVPTVGTGELALATVAAKRVARTAAMRRFLVLTDKGGRRNRRKEKPGDVGPSSRAGYNEYGSANISETTEPMSTTRRIAVARWHDGSHVHHRPYLRRLRRGCSIPDSGRCQRDELADTPIHLEFDARLLGLRARFPRPRQGEMTIQGANMP